MLEWGIKVEVSEDCPTQFKQDLIDTFEKKGGNPTLIGVVYVSPSTFSRRKVKYKIRYPDKSYEYLNFEKFEKFFKFSEEQ